MNVHSADGIHAYQFASLDQSDVVHGVFARRGGVSAGPYASLNMSISTGDDLENVRQNRWRGFRALGRDPDSVADVWQVHSAEVLVADEPRGSRDHLGKADALITDRRRVTLFMRFADCVPILLFDPKHHALGLVHAGWRGTLLKIVAAAVRAMSRQYGSKPIDLLAGIGPSIGPCHYEVGPEVVEQTRAFFGGAADQLLARTNGRYHLDLWAANAHALREVGVERIEQSEICTACRTDEFFSHRAEQGQTGRFGALMGLR
jgi:YfiH family protein